MSPFFNFIFVCKVLKMNPFNNLLGASLSLKTTDTLGLQNQITNLDSMEMLNFNIHLKLAKSLPSQVANLKYAAGISRISLVGENVVKAILSEAGELNVMITSTNRTVRRQAEIMYSPNDKVKRNKNGRTVRALRDKMKNEGFSEAATIDAMEAKILELGQNTISNHLNDTYITIDLGKNAFKNKNWAVFTKILDDYKKKGKIHDYIDEIPPNNCFHIEILK
jgi:hypothetical protein